MSTQMPAKVQVGRFFRTVLPALLLLCGGVLLGFGVLVYRLTHPGPVAELVNPSNFLLPSAEATWSLRDGVQLSGWWIPGARNAPAVILVPGIFMNRSDALSLAVSLHRRDFGVLTFDLRGRGAAPTRASALGLRETADVLSAIDYVKSRESVDATRLGIWGVDVGARAALDAAAQRPEVRAVAADSPFETVADFVQLRLAEDLGGASRFVEFGCLHLFRAYMLAPAAALRQSLPLGSLSDRSILFVQGNNRKALARTTEALYSRLEPRKEMISVATSRVRVMSGEDLKDYDRQVTNFFNLNLPAGRAGERRTPF